MEIFEEIIRLNKEGRNCATATIVQCSGSSPQKEGAKILVRDDGTIMGTLGGGCIESEAIQAALIAMRDGVPAGIPFELTEKKGGLVCGGRVTVFIEPFLTRPHMVILGAGHIGKALARAARFCGFRVTVGDNRAEYANPLSIPDANETVVQDFENFFSQFKTDKNTFIVIATRGHIHDLAGLRSALQTGAAYIGLLGSRRKKAVLFNTLLKEGFTSSQIERVNTPVGLPIGSVTPGEIAVSIMAQIIQVRRKNGKQGFGDPACGGILHEDVSSKAPAPDREQTRG